MLGGQPKMKISDAGPFSSFGFLGLLFRWKPVVLIFLVSLLQGTAAETGKIYREKPAKLAAKSAQAIEGTHIGLVSLTTNQLMALSLVSPSGSTNVVQVSTNLADWQTIGLLTNLTGQMEFLDTNSPPHLTRFYRFYVTSQPVAPVILAHPTNRTFYAGGAAVFRVQAIGSAPLSFQWQKDQLDLSNQSKYLGISNHTLIILSATSTDEGEYSVVVSNSGGSITSSPAVLVMQNTPRSALEWKNLGYLEDRHYTIDPDGPDGNPPFNIPCIMTLSGGGWTALTDVVANSILNTNATVAREYLYVQNSTRRWYRTPISNLVWDWASGKDLYGTYFYSTENGESFFEVTESNERQSFGVGGSSGPGGTPKCLVIYPNCLNPATAQVMLCQDSPGIFNGPCVCDVTVYVREVPTP